MNTLCIVSESDRELLVYNGLDGFESLWNADLSWFEEPNHRRNGWSGVSKHVLKRPEGGTLAVFIKRQQNHNFRTLLHPLRGLPTVYREYRNISRMKKHGVRCPDPVFYGHRNAGGRWQAILVTRSLEGYRPLEDSLSAIDQDNLDARRALLTSVAQTLRQMHRHHRRHSCLYAKHILVRAENADGPNGDGTHQFDAAVIDLEKMCACFPSSHLVLHDLDQLYRHWRRRKGDWDTLIDSYSAHVASGALAAKIRHAWRQRTATELVDPEPPCSDRTEPSEVVMPSVGFGRQQADTRVEVCGSLTP